MIIDYKGIPVMASNIASDNRIRRARKGLFSLSFKIILNLIFLLLISYLGWRGYLFLSSSPRFSFTRLEVRGIRYSSFPGIKSSLSFYYGESLFRIDLFRVREVLLTSPWIEDAVVSRMFPDGLRIELKEAEPMAVLEIKGREMLLTSKGTKIPLEEFIYKEEAAIDQEAILDGLPRFKLESSSSPSRLIAACELLSAANKIVKTNGERITNARLSDSSGLIINLSRFSPDIVVGDGGGIDRLRCLFEIYHELLRFGGRVERIDLRFAGAIILKKKLIRGADGD
jgi:hypothetical protein